MGELGSGPAPGPRTRRAQQAPEAPATLAAYEADAARLAAARPREQGDAYPRVRRSLVLPGLALAAVSVAVGLAAEPVLQLATVAATGLVDTTAYVEAVLGP